MQGRLVLGYVLIFAVSAGLAATSFVLGADRKPAPNVAGVFQLPSGKRLALQQSGEFVNAVRSVTGTSVGDCSGKLRLRHRRLRGTVRCAGGGGGALDVSPTGVARRPTLVGRLAGRPLRAPFAGELPKAGLSAKPASTAKTLSALYDLSTGDSLALVQAADGRTVKAVRSVHGEPVGDCTGALTLEAARLHGPLACRKGPAEPLDARVSFTAKGQPGLAGRLGGRPVKGVYAEPLPASAPTNEQIFGRLMLAIAAVILAARLVRGVIGRIGQPPVIGEVLAGILLGPTLLGTLLPSIQHYLFPSFILPLLTAGADIGLAFYMFLVGLELDPRQLRGRVGEAAAVSNASILFPLGLGIAVALPFFRLLGPQTRYAPFALFMGVSMSITAFPVLARILIDRRMLRRPTGALALSAAAVDDVTAWGLLAIASGVASRGTPLKALPLLGYVFAFCLLMALLARPLLNRVAAAYDEAGHVPAGWIATIFVGVLLSAFLAMKAGVAPIFGAFVMGLIMPRRADLTHDVTRRLEDFVSTVLLPLFFVVTGLRTQIGLLDRPILWLLTLALIGVAVAGKWLGAMYAASLAGRGLRESAVIGALMNTRGLTELIVLNIGLELGVVSPTLFAMLVIMALVTTFMAAPAIRLLDPRGLFSAPLDDELRERAAEVAPPALPVPERSILVAILDERNTDVLLAVAEPLARSRPPRELVLARLLAPPRVAVQLGPEEREISRATRELARLRSSLVREGVATRTVAFISPDRGRDLLRLVEDERVDLAILDGRRPLLGAGVPRGAVGALLEKAPCDVAVLVEREGVPLIDAEHPVVVPFGGDEHDWAALELGAWIATMYEAPLHLLGAESDGRGDASRLLGSASLVVQQMAGIAAEPVLVASGRVGVLDAAATAGLLVVGLSERWRQEGLGELRAALARHAPAPILFVRRGLRPGALSPRGGATSFGWSSVAPAPVGAAPER